MEQAMYQALGNTRMEKTMSLIWKGSSINKNYRPVSNYSKMRWVQKYCLRIEGKLHRECVP